MRWLRFTANDQPSWGIVEGDQVVAVSGDPFREWQRTPRTYSLADVRIELPLIPRTFVEIEITGIGTLRNKFVAGMAPENKG